MAQTDPPATGDAPPERAAAPSSGGLGIGVVEFKIQRAKGEQFFWTLHDTRHDTAPMAQSGNYPNKQLCLESITKIQKNAEAASVLDLTT